MKSLHDNLTENVHVLHQSLVVLIFKGAIAWLLALTAFLVLQSTWGTVENIFSSNTPVVFSSTPIVLTTSPWQTGLNVLLLFVYGWLVLLIVLRWIYNYYIIEPHFIIIRKGIIFSQEDRLNMEATESVEVRQGLFGKLFNFGTLKLYNPEQQHELILENVSNPYNEAEFIRKFCPSANIVHLPLKAGHN